MKLTKEQLKDIAIRTGKTALVAFVTAFAGAIVLIATTDLNGIKIGLYNALIASGTTAGTAILNVLVKLFTNFLNDGQLTEEEINEAFGDYTNSEG